MSDRPGLAGDLAEGEAPSVMAHRNPGVRPFSAPPGPPTRVASRLQALAGGAVCFSPEADLLTGIVVSGVGIDALRHTKHRRYLPLALLPLLFGAHQLVEAVAWWGFEDRVPVRVGEMATWLYLAFAFVVVPPLVPWAVRSVEVDPARRRRLLPWLLAGGVISLWCVWAAVTSVAIAREVRTGERQ